MKVLCVSDYFLPGFLAGGPITTLVNMRKQLAGQVTFSIFTRDRDLGSDIKYENIDTNRWLETPDGPVYYATPNTFGSYGLRKALATREFDIIYFNSFFSPHASILPYLTVRGHLPKRRMLIAPRGEFSLGALAAKKHKKLAFMSLVRLLGLYRDVLWHASTPMEARDILRQFPNAADRILVAADPVLASPPNANTLRMNKLVGRLRICFISRISPMKNLDGLIRMLFSMPVPIELDIFGPIEDNAYWQLCQQGLAMLPENIQTRMHGPIDPAMVSDTFLQYDLFAFPTHGENFGHVIYESLRAGTPVLISDQTPWKSDESGAVTALAIDDESGWRSAILKAAMRTPEEHERVCSAALDYANRYANKTGSLTENLEMFRKVLLHREPYEQ